MVDPIPASHVTPTKTLFDACGRNTGNLAFFHALATHIEAEITYVGWDFDAEVVNAEADCLVVAAAAAALAGLQELMFRCWRRLRAVAQTGLFLNDYYAYQARGAEQIGVDLVFSHRRRVVARVRSRPVSQPGGRALHDAWRSDFRRAQRQKRKPVIAALLERAPALSPPDIDRAAFDIDAKLAEIVRAFAL